MGKIFRSVSILTFCTGASPGISRDEVLMNGSTSRKAYRGGLCRPASVHRRPHLSRIPQQQFIRVRKRCVGGSTECFWAHWHRSPFASCSTVNHTTLPFLVRLHRIRDHLLDLMAIGWGRWGGGIHVWMIGAESMVDLCGVRRW